jgi:glutamyl-tRNA synthetase
MSKVDSMVSMDMLLAENKKLIDPIAKHLFFVRDPVKIIVKDAPKTEAKLRLHPSNDVGFREYHTNGTFYIDREDASVLKKGELIRLKDLMGLRITAKADDCISAEIAPAQEGKIMQWVSDGNYMKCSVMIPGELLNDDETVRDDSLKVAEGYVESYASKLKEREIVQFERFGYCILDEEKILRFIFISR